VRRYRYRTPALTGPWRESRALALDDAVKAKQAQADEDRPERIRWIVPGEIEERGSEDAPSRARS
jgi:hypothetical protein